MECCLDFLGFVYVLAHSTIPWLFTSLPTEKQKGVRALLVAQWIFPTSFDWMDKCFPNVSRKAERKFVCISGHHLFSFGSSQTPRTWQGGCLY